MRRALWMVLTALGILGLILATPGLLIFMGFWELRDSLFPDMQKDGP